MKVRKIVHSCLLIEVSGKHVLTDPGIYLHEIGEISLPKIDVVTISHEHIDHFDIATLKGITKDNPSVKIVTNTQVDEQLKSQGLTSVIVEEDDEAEIAGITIRGFGKYHKEAFPNLMPQDEHERTRNVSYLIANRLYHTGDSLIIPNVQIEILAFPMIGGWMKTEEVADFIERIQPTYCLPIHNGSLREDRWVGFWGRLKEYLENYDIEFIKLKEGDDFDFR